MKLQIALGAIAASALIGFGALAGSVVGGAWASAPTGTVNTQYQASQMQVPQTQAQAQATAAPAPNTAPGTEPNERAPGHRGDHFGGGGFGFGKGFPGGPAFGGPGFGGREGRGFGAATADAANNIISRTTTLLTTVRGDLAYANGKMDTSSITKWLNDADKFIGDAKSAVSAQKYGSAVAYAQSASELAELAEQQMGQTLGFDKLPSAAQRPQRPQRPNSGTQTPPTLTQAQASRVLSQAYNAIVAQGTLIKNGKSSDANAYLADAQNAYKAAYSAYGTGKYQDAVNSARLANQLLGVASSLNRAATDTTTGTDQPVTVPAPNF
jgi:hypothetical protein